MHGSAGTGLSLMVQFWHQCNRIMFSVDAAILYDCVTHQVSVLTDQVEAQGEKIRDLESSLEEHRQKLASTEEMLQQVTHGYETHKIFQQHEKPTLRFLEASVVTMKLSQL